MKRLCHFLAEPQCDRLAAESESSGLSQSELIRRALDVYWERRQVVFERGGDSNGSQEVKSDD